MTAKKETGHAHKHVASSKHHGTSKHSPSGSKKSPAGHKTAKVTTKGKHPAHAKARGFAVGDLLPVCAFEALAMSLRLAGQFVDDEEVAGLWELAGSPALGASLPAALDAASLHGLGGGRPHWGRLERLGPVRLADQLGLPGRNDESAALGPFEDFFAGDGHALILGVDVPGPHAVLATADGWWSWGELHDPWPCTVEEAWAVSW